MKQLIGEAVDCRIITKNMENNENSIGECDNCGATSKVLTGECGKRDVI